jgi:hypothetical protein
MGVGQAAPRRPGLGGVLRLGRRLAQPAQLGASFERPCTVCGTTAEPRQLIRIGTYPDGDSIERPTCLRCRVLLHLRGCEPHDRELQMLAAYEVARRGDRRRVPTAKTLAAAIAERTSGRPQLLTAGWPATTATAEQRAPARAEV